MVGLFDNLFEQFFTDPSSQGLPLRDGAGFDLLRAPRIAALPAMDQLMAMGMRGALAAPVGMPRIYGLPRSSSTGGSPAGASPAAVAPAGVVSPAASMPSLPTAGEEPEPTGLNDGSPIVAGGFSPYDAVFGRYAGGLAGDPQFMATVAAGAFAESGFNPRAIGDSGHSVGLFQMHDRGAGAGLGDSRYDPDVQAQHMLPRYAAAYQKYRALGYQGAQLAAWVAAEAERPLGWDNPNGAAHANYRRAYARVTAGQAPANPAAAGGDVGLAR